MATILPFFLILLSLATIIVIVIRKFPRISLLDVDNLPEVKLERKKDEFWKKRVEEKAKVSQKELSARLRPFFQRLKDIQLQFRQYVGKVERLLMQEKIRRFSGTGTKDKTQAEDIRTFLQEGQFALANGSYEDAEEKFLSVIRLDQKNVDAYRGLGDVYYKLKKFDEAEETFQFLIQLDPEEDQTFVRLGELKEEEGNVVQAIEYYQQAILLNPNISSRFARLADVLREAGQQESALAAIQEAVELEPQNPKYLDNLTEVSILAGDKKLAEQALQQLRMVNPENQKIDILKDKIEHMASS
ncbi:MAG TPA: hypothetical protein DCY48_04230 [Candidatus Magasanikbacteria bacterium]|nr:MAG: hypothetical protein A3I74_00215 [Candidatus Magasanikbacteria bacterium RIFCSPLOWO2_02_FULL_47_16]OGH80120.1 MAG: hypothetical protein A3C10_03015 [Candidatus Magasanikbacteria bacterium RIFCSPHIGHO2_02_FULL_48_18]OGH83199.1 MAG: hypothetical protein A3G08_02730 [Candidatus Magasanikbacteria bacterium RIFCSPLOWO2_12_FULL_47_9b]HAZ28950.1 hypothetical protein [Candidatus Magasanikbacteria bacterium]